MLLLLIIVSARNCIFVRRKAETDKLSPRFERKKRIRFLHFCDAKTLSFAKKNDFIVEKSAFRPVSDDDDENESNQNADQNAEVDARVSSRRRWTDLYEE